MASVEDNLSKILSAKYGEEVRGSIHDAIKDCYNYSNGSEIEQMNDRLNRFSDRLSITYISKSDVTDPNNVGHYWNEKGVKLTTDDVWSAVGPIHLPAGEYVFSGISFRFSYFKEDGDQSTTNNNFLNKHAESLCCRFIFNNSVTIWITAYKLVWSRYGVDPFVVSVSQYHEKSVSSTNGAIEYLDQSSNFMLSEGRILKINGEGMHVANSNVHTISNTLFPNTKLLCSMSDQHQDIGFVATELVPPSGYIVYDYEIDVSGASESMFDVDAVIEKNDGSVTFIPVHRSNKNEKVRAILDLNNYAVYNDAKSVGLALIGHNRLGENPNFVVTSHGYPYWTDHALDSDRYDPNLVTWISNVDKKTSEIESSPSSPSSERMLISPNGSKYRLSVSDTGALSAIPVVPNKAYYFGNSLLTGFGPFGMAADDRKSDYYALINSYIKQKNSNFESKGKLNIATWEGMTDVSYADSWVDTNIIPLINDSYDLIVIQACDNCNTNDKQKIFPETSLHLMQKVRTKCPTANVVWIASWFAQNLVDGLAKNAAATGVTLVDVRSFYGGKNNSYVGAVYSYGESEDNWEVSVSSYSDDTEQKTLTFTVNGASSPSTVRYSEYTDNIKLNGKLLIKGPDRVVTSSGVASHPSTRGFKCIANKFLYETGISDVEETYPLD